MPASPRISAARFCDHTGASDSTNPPGAGAQAVSSYLREHAGDDYAVVEIERADERFSLIIDAEWARLATSTGTADGSLVEGMELPRNTLLAVVAGWVTDWNDATSDLEVQHSHDQIPHLRLRSIRRSSPGADRNAKRS